MEQELDLRDLAEIWINVQRRTLPEPCQITVSRVQSYGRYSLYLRISSTDKALEVAVQPGILEWSHTHSHIMSETYDPLNEGYEYAQREDAIKTVKEIVAAWLEGRSHGIESYCEKG